jgi:hypothetical protein
MEEEIMSDISTAWEKIGTVGIDSATVVIADPCNGTDVEAAFSKYVEAIDAADPCTRPKLAAAPAPGDLSDLNDDLSAGIDAILNLPARPRLAAVGSTGEPELPDMGGLATFAGTGDGTFDVEARYVTDAAGSRVVAELRIVFIGEDEQGLYSTGWRNEDGTRARLRDPAARDAP